jgi:hypothetical protein
MKRHPKHPVLLLVAIAAVHLNITWITWRDLRSRSDEQLRGSKNVWRLVTAANTLGSVAYWTLGRR